MPIRRNAHWQERLDERILELLDGEPWSMPGVMQIELPIEVTEGQIKERCLRLADVGLVAIEPAEGWRVELTTEGKLYLEGETDVSLYPSPRSARSLEDYESRC